MKLDEHQWRYSRCGAVAVGRPSIKPLIHGTDTRQKLIERNIAIADARQSRLIADLSSRSFSGSQTELGGAPNIVEGLEEKSYVRPARHNFSLKNRSIASERAEIARPPKINRLGRLKANKLPRARNQIHLKIITAAGRLPQNNQEFWGLSAAQA